jgi:hypothetical protein
MDIQWPRLRFAVVFITFLIAVFVCSVKLDSLLVAVTNIAVVWDVTPLSLVEAHGSTAMPAHFCHNAWPHVPECSDSLTYAYNVVCLTSYRYCRLLSIVLVSIVLVSIVFTWALSDWYSSASLPAVRLGWAVAVKWDQLQAISWIRREIVFLIMCFVVTRTQRKSAEGYFVSLIIIFSGSAAQRGLWLPCSRGFLITHNDALQSVGLWTSVQLVAEFST